MRFASRHHAGQELGWYLKDQGVEVDFVLGLPRGGVVVAAEVVQVIGGQLDVLIVRKVGHPDFREFAVGALAEPDVVLLDRSVIQSLPISQSQLDAVIEEEKARLKLYQERFHRRTMPILCGKRVLLVDDGLATGATMEAAILSARQQLAGGIQVAVPVASRNAVDRLRRVTDAIYALEVDPAFEAVGSYYSDFGQTSDHEVQELLLSD